MKENNILKPVGKKYLSPDIELIGIDTVDIIRTSDEWDLPEIPIADDPLAIG